MTVNEGVWKVISECGYAGNHLFSYFLPGLSLGLFQVHSWKFQTALIERKKYNDIYIKQATMQAFKLFYLGQMFWFSFYKRITISFWVFGPLPLTEPVELGLKQNQLGWVQANVKIFFCHLKFLMCHIKFSLI